MQSKYASTGKNNSRQKKFSVKKNSRQKFFPGKNNSCQKKFPSKKNPDKKKSLQKKIPAKKILKKKNFFQQHFCVTDIFGGRYIFEKRVQLYYKYVDILERFVNGIYVYCISTYRFDVYSVFLWISPVTLIYKLQRPRFSMCKCFLYLAFILGCINEAGGINCTLDSNREAIGSLTVLFSGNGIERKQMVNLLCTRQCLLRLRIVLII